MKTYRPKDHYDVDWSIDEFILTYHTTQKKQPTKNEHQKKRKKP